MYKKYFSLAIILLITGCSNEYLDVDSCQSKGVLDLICDMQNPEDFAKIPEEDSLVVSQFAGLAELNHGKINEGKLSRLNLNSKEVVDFNIVFLENNITNLGQKNCQPYSSFYPHGIDLYYEIKVEGENLSPFLEEAYLLAVVNHTSVDRIEFFLLFPDYVNFSDAGPNTLYWVGCVEGPNQNTYFNDVVITDADGSFYATHQYDKDMGLTELTFHSVLRLDTGFVYQWSPADGFTKLFDSGGAWPNGIEIMDDRLYVSYRMNGSIGVFANGNRTDHKLRNYLGGGADNLLVVGDEIWVAVQNTDLGGFHCINESLVQCPTPFSVQRYSKDLKLLERHDFQDVAFGGASVAYGDGKQIIIGAYKADRIAVFTTQ